MDANTVQIVDDLKRQPECWRDGVTTFPLVSAAGGSTELCIFEQVCQPGHGVPTHRQKVEELLEVKEDSAEILVRAESNFVGENQSVLITAGVSYSFSNSGDKTLRVRATRASLAFEAVYESAEEVFRGWEAG